MYEMLTGRVPFDADTPVSVALKHMQEDVVAPKEVNPKIPSALNDIILKAMRKDTTLRYQSATEMLRDLNKALKNPEGDFVDNSEYEETEATRTIPTLNNQEIKSEREKINNNKNGKKQNFFKKHPKLSVTLIVIILFIASIIGTVTYLNATSPKEVAIPNLVGMSKEEAEKLLKENNLLLGEVVEEYNSEYAEGYVISQDPEFKANYNIKEQTSINIHVSLGIEETIVPKVVGMTEDEAIKALEEAKLKYEVKEQESKKVESGYVIKQEIDPETTVNAGDTITIYVSTGVKMSTVPSVIGKSQKDAKKEIEKAGLKALITTGEDTSKDNGTVIKQSIDAGKEVEEGSTVTITVNEIVETKTANITVNVKSLLNGKHETEEVPTGEKDEDGNDITEEKIKDVTVKITVDSDTVYKEKMEPTTTNLMTSISGKGTVTVKIYIDDVLKKAQDINLNEETKVTIE